MSPAPGLAYASIAKLPPQYGLYSSFAGVFVYAILGGAKDVTLGPTAIMSLLTAALITAVPEENNPEHYIDPAHAVLLTFLCGCVQFLMGLFQLGRRSQVGCVS